MDLTFWEHKDRGWNMTEHFVYNYTDIIVSLTKQVNKGNKFISYHNEAIEISKYVLSVFAFSQVIIMQ